MSSKLSKRANARLMKLKGLAEFYSSESERNQGSISLVRRAFCYVVIEEVFEIYNQITEYGEHDSRHSVVSKVSAIDGRIVYFRHWEDGEYRAYHAEDAHEFQDRVDDDIDHLIQRNRIRR